MRELGAIRRIEANEERRVRRILHLRAVALHRRHRGPRIEADGDRVLRAVDLDPDVVAGLVVPRGLEQTDRTAAQLQHRRRGGDVAPLRVLRVPEGRAGRVDLVDLVAEHPARHVEVVDELIYELTTGRLDVRVGRRQRVAARHVEAVDGADLATAHPTARLLESRIEAALETDLYSPFHFLHVVDDAFGRLEVQRDGLLAEDREAHIQRVIDQLRVRAGRRDDDRGVRTGQGLVDGGRVLRAELLRER